HGSAAMIEKLIKAGADVNPRLTKYGDTALMMAARTGKPDAVKVLLDNGAEINSAETWGGTTALMWAVSESHPDAAKLLIDRGANVNARSKIVPSEGRRGGSTANSSVTSLPRDPQPGEKPKKDYYGGFTPLHFAVRQGDMESTRLLVAAGADVNTITADGKGSLELELVELLLSYGADPNIASSHAETALMQAAGYAWIDGYSRGKSNAERLQVIKLLVELGANVNAADDMGITALMAAGHLGDPPIIQYLVDVGADLGAHDLGKKNDGQFGGSIEPLMAIDYAIGVGTFRP